MELEELIRYLQQEIADADEAGDTAQVEVLSAKLLNAESDIEQLKNGPPVRVPCRTCNQHRKVTGVNWPCAGCGEPLKDARPVGGVINYYQLDENDVSVQENGEPA